MNTSYCKRNNILAIIPARGGSKGIKLKNIKHLGGKPLIYYSMRNALQSKYINHIVVATDSTEIADTVIGLFPDIEVIMRPPDISHDLSKTEETLLYVLEKRKADIVVTLEPTNPFIEVKYIDEAIEMVNSYDSCLLVVEDFGFFLDDGDLLERPMRQEKIPRLREAGGCWVTKSETLVMDENRLGGNMGFVVVPKRCAIHLDDEDDWEMAEALMWYNNK